jgi:hypothetical protein
VEIFTQVRNILVVFPGIDTRKIAKIYEKGILINMVLYLIPYPKHSIMPTYLRLGTVQKKIAELQTALFYELSESVLKIPVSVIQVLTTDELGQIWFVMPFHFHYQQKFDRDFLSELHFFRKGKDFYLNITGRGCLVLDPEEVNNTFSIPVEIKKKVQAKDLVLLKVKIRTVDYFERKIQSAKKDYKNILYQLFSGLFSDSQVNYLNYRVLHSDR